jgi:ribosomal protein S18 acetylase RimI-like enzyme
MSPSADSVTIEVLHEKHFADLARMQKDFLNSKFMCCCIPLGSDENEARVRRVYDKCPEMMKVGAVCVLDDRVVGFIQMVLHGMPCDLHKVEKGEAYVYMIAIDPDARGMGIGTKLLNWSEEIARERGCQKMSLDVVGGNKAIGLYERKGYSAQPESCISLPFTFLFVCFVMGPIIRPTGSPAYYSRGRAISMEKELE